METLATPAPRTTGRLAYQSALDGLRAVAILAVMAFHDSAPWATGGFLGVDVFFVLSGFLISTLLAEEHARSGRIRLQAFYLRRALRLLPALVALCAVLQLYSLNFVFAQQVAELRRETVATLLYVANWAQAFGAVDPLGFLGHAWSLAIEEQFYIVWPLVLGALLPALSRSAAIAAIIAGAAGSAVLRAALWHGPESAARVFHGSDTRAEALLIGCALALVLHQHHRDFSAAWKETVRAAALAGVVALALLLHFASPEAAWMYRGGFTLAALASAAILAELRISPAGWLAGALSLAPLVAIGRISYGLYLWHWPVDLVLAPQWTGLPPALLSLARLAATLSAATLSWLLVERPFLRWKQRWT